MTPSRRAARTLSAYLVAAFALLLALACLAVACTSPTEARGPNVSAGVWHIVARNGLALPTRDMPSEFVLTRGGLSIDAIGIYAFVVLDSFPNSLTFSIREVGIWHRAGELYTFRGGSGERATALRYSDGRIEMAHDSVRYTLEPGAP